MILSIFFIVSATVLNIFCSILYFTYQYVTAFNIPVILTIWVANNFSQSSIKKSFMELTTVFHFDENEIGQLLL